MPADSAARCEACGTPLVDVRTASGVMEPPVAVELVSPQRRGRGTRTRNIVAVAIAVAGGAAVIAGLLLIGDLRGSDAVKKAPPRPPAPLARARLAGGFRAVEKTTSTWGYESLEKGDTMRSTWTFTPTCRKGPCSVRLKISYPGSGDPLSTAGLLAPPDVTMTLRRSGAVYQGAGPASIVRCDVMNWVEGRMTVRLRVTKGRWIGDVWRASRAQGSVRYSAPQTQSLLDYNQVCRAAGYTARLTASR
jgi:hypothetical protein